MQEINEMWYTDFELYRALIKKRLIKQQQEKEKEQHG